MLWILLLPCLFAIKFEIDTSSQGVQKCIYQTFSKDLAVAGKIVDDGPQDMGSKYFSKNSLDQETSFKFTTTTWYKPIKFCFLNTLNAGASPSPVKRTITLHLEIGHEIEGPDHTETTNKLKPNEGELNRLYEMAQEVMNEMNYLESQEKDMRDLNEATNERVRNFRLLSMISFVVVGGWQIYYLKSYFQKKKLI